MEMPERSIFATSSLSPSFTIMPTPGVDISTLSPVLLSDIIFKGGSHGIPNINKLLSLAQ